MILLAVFLLSLSSLFFEVLLARIFSITQFNHLSFMVISIALFGFAASGTFLNILDARRKGIERRLTSTVWIFAVTMLYSISAIMAFVIMNRLPLDYFRLPIEPVQTLYLLATYLLLSLPFFFTGFMISVAYTFIPAKIGFVYCASMAGSACGAILPVMLLPFFSEGKLIIIAALIPLIILPFGISKPFEMQARAKNVSRKKWFVLTAFCLGITFGAGMIALTGSSMTAVKPSPYKALSQALQLPDTRLTSTAADIRGRVDAVKSPYMRFAPGLSLTFTDVLPGQEALFKDGDDPFFLYNVSGPKDLQFSNFNLLYSGYLLAPEPENILLIQHGGGGLGIPCAMASGARKITIVQPHPLIAGNIRRHYKIPVLNQHPRAFLARCEKRFSLIHIENWGTSLPGSDALTQQYLFTVESLKEYLNHLKKDGILIISRKLLLPPADSIRLWATAFESLKQIGVKNPGPHIAVLRNWSAFTLIVTVQPLTNTDELVKFARKRNFDLVYLDGLSVKMANRFNIFNRPFHFIEINRLAEAYRSGTEKVYFEAYPLDVVPQTDSRPFPGRFLKWPKLKALYKISGSRFYSLFMSGEIIVAVVFMEAALVAVLLLILPLLFIPQNGPKPYIPHILYFLAVGAGFMFLELFFIKKYVFLFGDPVVSFTVVLAGILVCSGLGGYCSQRMGFQGLRYGLAALTAVLILVFFGLDIFIYRILGLPTILRYTAAFLLLIPCGFLAGLPFPLGMRCLLKRPSQRAYAWAVNGCASVLAAIAAAQIALCTGISAILVCAAAAYLLALISTIDAR